MFDGLIDNMKQLQNQYMAMNSKRNEEIPSSQNPSYTSKSIKYHFRSLPKPIKYIFKEQRLYFMLMGISIASLFFILKRNSSLPCSPDSTAPTTITGGLVTQNQISSNNWPKRNTGRVPIGIGNRRLRIVVTGGAGFLGSHLVDKLIARGDEVIVIDNFFTGRKDNLAHHFGNPRFELIRHDIVDPILLEVDQIYHLACSASPIHYKYNPVKTMKTNVMGTLNMLGLAKRTNAKFLLTSTSGVYGDPLEHPQKETYWGHVNPIGKRSCYDEGKRAAETLTIDHYREAGVDVRIARVFNTYGPRMCLDDGRVVSNFVAQVIRKQPITIYGNGRQSRSFLYVTDLIDGLVVLMESEQLGPFNLGNPEEFTMLELATVVREVVDPAATIEFRPTEADDLHMRKPDISKAKELLNWEPRISLREGLPLMVVDFKNRILSEDRKRETLLPVKIDTNQNTTYVMNTKKSQTKEKFEKNEDDTSN